jgi:hypothetical protein
VSPLNVDVFGPTCCARWARNQGLQIPPRLRVLSKSIIRCSQHPGGGSFHSRTSSTRRVLLYLQSAMTETKKPKVAPR